jgi:hypothetical protein
LLVVLHLLQHKKHHLHLHLFFHKEKYLFLLHYLVRKYQFHLNEVHKDLLIHHLLTLLNYLENTVAGIG